MARVVGIVQIRHVRMVCVIMWRGAVEAVQVQYFREGMLALPYNGLRKFNGASGFTGAERYFREGMLALPYRWLP